MCSILDAAEAYRGRGFALARIKPGKKRPTNKEWNRYSAEPESFTECDGIGIQTGPLSGNLVCVDLDSPEALALANQFLPPTQMVEGRPGKRRSHRWYRVVNVPPELKAAPSVAGGIGGPRTRRFRVPSKGMVVEFGGTGSQAVVPPSLWTSKDGTKWERREWDDDGEPAVMDCRELFDAVCGLAVACGYPAKKTKSLLRRARPSTAHTPSERLPIPPGEAARQARQFVARMEPAIEGQGGDHQTFCVACVLVIDFGLSPDEALPLLIEFNERCLPPWTLEGLQHKLTAADALTDGPRGWRIRKRKRTILVNVKTDDQEVLVGVGCADQASSFIDLSTMGAAIVNLQGRRHLVAELEAVSWEGKTVLLTPPSTIATNRTEVWVEFFLARLLRERGATVLSMHIPDRDGRKQTFATAGGEGKVVEPPRDARQAHDLAEAAARRAHELDSYRKALPRNKPSPKLNSSNQIPY